MIRLLESLCYHLLATLGGRLVLLYSSVLGSVAKEMRELSNKKQECLLSVTKVEMINRVIKPVKDTFLAELPSSNLLDLLDEDALPNNSDAVLVISQYKSALKEFQSEFYVTNCDDYGSRSF